MSDQYIDIGLSDALILSVETAERVISSKSGDAALLLLYLMKNHGHIDPEPYRIDHKLTREQLDRAMEIIRGNGSPRVPSISAPDIRSDSPSYTAKELADAARDPNFAFILNTVEQTLGRPLLQHENGSLFSLYNYYCIPAEVMAILVNHLTHEAELASTPTHPVFVSFADVKKTALDWHKRGIVTADEADIYVKELEELSSGIRKCVSMMGIGGRKLTAGEKRMLTRFLEIDPSFALIELAYEMTVFNTGGLKWNYMSKILESWHEKGYKTPADVSGKHDKKRRTNDGGNEIMIDPETRGEYEEQVLEFIRSQKNGDNQ